LKVKILYFASIREKLGRDAEEIDVPAGIATVAGLRGYLQQRGGAWADALGDSKLLRMAVNQDMAKNSAAIKAGDEIAFFPPVTGG
jgi:molybdopterin synthase sulfur carrier subunit